MNYVLSIRFDATRGANRLKQLKEYDALGFTSKVEDLIRHLLMKEEPTDFSQVFEELTPELFIKVQSEVLRRKEASKKNASNGSS